MSGWSWELRTSSPGCGRAQRRTLRAGGTSCDIPRRERTRRARLRYRHEVTVARRQPERARAGRDLHVNLRHACSSREDRLLRCNLPAERSPRHCHRHAASFPRASPNGDGRQKTPADANRQTKQPDDPGEQNEKPKASSSSLWGLGPARGEAAPHAGRLGRGAERFNMGDVASLGLSSN